MKTAALLYAFISVCLCSYSQNTDQHYLKGFCQVTKMKHYAKIHVLDMKYRFAVCDSKGTVIDKIENSTTSFTPNKGGGGNMGIVNRNSSHDFNLVIIEQNDDKGIFVFDIVIRYKGKIFQAKLKKLIPFNGSQTEFFSFNMNDYVKDPELLKKLDEYYAKRHKRFMISINDPNQIYFDYRPPKKFDKTEWQSAPLFKKGSLEKYYEDEKKGLNIKDSTNVERIKLGLEPILSLSESPITWEVKQTTNDNKQK